MSDADLWAAWRMWMVVAGAVIVIAAGLLITIWLTARKILADAVRALNAATAIRENTQPIWGLQHTNTIAGDILDTVRAIEAKGAALSGALAAKGVQQ